MNRQLLVAAMKRRSKHLIKEIQDCRAQSKPVLEAMYIAKNCETLDWIEKLEKWPRNKYGK